LRLASVSMGCGHLRTVSINSNLGRNITHPLSTLFASGIDIGIAYSFSGVAELARVLLVTKELGLMRLACVASSLLSTMVGVLTSRCRSSVAYHQYIPTSRYRLTTYARCATWWSLYFEMKYHLPALVLHLDADAEDLRMEVSQKENLCTSSQVAAQDP
jgi:hypothetical protein